MEGVFVRQRAMVSEIALTVVRVITNIPVLSIKPAPTKILASVFFKILPSRAVDTEKTIF